MPVPVPVVLTILDGWGIAEPSPTNAVSVAATPNMDRLSGSYPMTTLTAHNGLVGLPEGQMGNSEVGHPEHRRRPQSSTRTSPASTWRRSGASSPPTRCSPGSWMR